MTHDVNETERFLQAAAERPGSADDDGEVARHRFVLYAIRTLPVPAPPANFAQEIEACLQDQPEEAAIEQWLLRIAAVAALALGVATVAPWLAASMTSLTATLGDVPWRLLMVMASGLAAFAVLDRCANPRP